MTLYRMLEHVIYAASFQVIAPQFSTNDFKLGDYAEEMVVRLNRHLDNGTLSDIDEKDDSAGLSCTH